MRYTPFESMDRLFEQMRSEMAGFDWDLGTDLGSSLTEHDGKYVFTADLPGFEREEIDLRFEDGSLVLSATHEVGDEAVSRRRSVSERIAVPAEVIKEGITASYHNGVLEVHLPIVADSAVGHEIDIE